ncbi:MAG: hypothetical protein KGM15_16280, partial [Pseudomonadota bacterium]|nr:hypothetical protein [Pseudomonadota bacterium]
MKVIVNALGYQGQSGGAGGAGVFLQYLVSRLAESCKVDVLVPQNSKAFTVRPRDVRFLELPYLTGGTLMHLRDGPTVVLDPFGSLPCDDFPDELGLCVIIHDLMHLEQPYYFVASEKEERSVGFARGLQRADSVIVFSADQARAVRRFFPGARPVVIPHLPYLTLQDAEPRTNLATLPAELDNYVLFPAVKWPHKNHKTVVEAFDAYIRHTGSDLQLVMCGGACAESRFSYLPALDGLSP